MEKGKVEIVINSQDAAHLIGYKGKTLDALQSTINNIVQKEESDTAKVFIDVNGYKTKKEEVLKNLAKKMAENVVKFRKTIKLEPMSSYERMIVHSELAGRKDVETESSGEEPGRRVIIKLKR
jgi:spoIIIJ-associated protein